MYTLVIADDERRICESMEAVIRDHFPNIEVIGTFFDGGDLYEFISKYRVDILITDIRMPGKTGIDIAKLIHENGHGTYCILITAYRDFDSAHKAVQYSVDDLLPKPFLSSDLLTTLENAIRTLQVRSSSTKHAQVLLRKLAYSLYKNPALHYENDFYENQQITFLNDRHCTQIVISPNDSKSLSGRNSTQWKNLVISAVERASDEITIVYAGTENDALVFLAFISSSFHDCTFSAFQNSIAEKLHNTVSIQLSPFLNIDAYLTYLVWSRRLTTFFATVSSRGLTHALADFKQALQQCTPSQCQEFAHFLESYYQVSPTGYSSDELLTCVEDMVKQTLQNHSSNIHLIDACKNYILQHLGDSNLSLESAACSLYVSSSYLSRVFRKKIGQTFSEYLQQARMERAKELISTTNLPTKEIASMVGYPNVSYFRNLFKALYGLTPLQYRQLQGSQEDTQ